MRLALLTTSYPSSPSDPAGHFVATEARHLARTAHVIVLTPSTVDAPAGDRSEGAQLTVRRVEAGSAFGWPGVAARVRERPLRALSVARFLRAARAALRALPALDRVVAHWALPSAFPITAGLGAPLTIVSHGADVRVLRALPSFVREQITARLLDAATEWRFVSAALRGELARSLSPVTRARLAAIATVAAPLLELPDVRPLIPALVAHHGLAGERLLVCVGRLVPGKRFDAALAHAAREERARVVVVGDGPERRRLEAHARGLGLDARFVGKAPREEALAWIAAADALLHASREEGLSTVVREAEALGVPVRVVA